MIANWSFQLRVFLSRISRVILNDIIENLSEAQLWSLFIKHVEKYI